MSLMECLIYCHSWNVDLTDFYLWRVDLTYEHSIENGMDLLTAINNMDFLPLL